MTNDGKTLSSTLWVNWPLEGQGCYVMGGIPTWESLGTMMHFSKLARAERLLHVQLIALLQT